MRGTLALLRSVIRRSVERYTDVTAYAAHLEDRLGALARIQAYIDANGAVDLATLVADEMQSYAVKEGDRLQLSGPPVFLQPRAGQTLGLAIHEMAVNAVEHGTSLSTSGHIEISWQIEQERTPPLFKLTWKETGAVGLAKPLREGFGTEVLTSMVSYELDAKTLIALEDDGMRYEISFPFEPRIGRLAS